jgi:peptide/nickel transport system substrate-binding protein
MGRHAPNRAAGGALMKQRLLFRWTTCAALTGVFAASTAWAAVVPGGGAGPAPKYGGVLNAMHREDPPSFSIIEEATVSVNWGVMPCYNNLVMFDPAKPQETPQTIVGDLAEKWAWGDGGKSLAFTLRRGVRWHDGRPFTSADVKYTFDLIREAPGMTAKLRLNPRKLWYAQIQSIETPDPATVLFRLKRPQPALLMMMASGYSPIYPAHVPPAELRTRCVGTGPFKLQAYRPGEVIEYVRNPDYFVKGRPYLEGIRFIIIKERGTRIAALQSGQLDIMMPQEGSKTAADQLKKAVPGMVITVASHDVNTNLLMNFKRAPFTDPRVRRALSLAIDRRGFIQAVRQGSALVGASLMPRPWGLWGLGPSALAALPGNGDGAAQKEAARRLLGEAGFGPAKPLRVTLSTRGIAVYIDMATYVIDQFKQVGVQATLEQVDSAVWFAKLARGDYELGANQTGMGADDPDITFYENYACGSQRNYSQYCNPDVDRMVDAESQEFDQNARQTQVAEIQKRLELDAARPIFAWDLDYFAMWPYVRGFVPHNNIYNNDRLQEVWLSR